jgi:hypothetical protein
LLRGVSIGSGLNHYTHGGFPILGKKNLKKSLVDIKFMYYLWGGGWAWFEYMLFYTGI